jgi:hypothetical protein
MSGGAAGGLLRGGAARATPPLGLTELLLFGAAAAFAGVTILWGIAPHDEGLMLQAAQRIADGQWPWRDFWWNYGPAQPLLLAIPAKLFGPSLLWWRLLRLVLNGLVSVLAYRLVRRDASAPVALAVWAAVAGAMAFPALPTPTPALLALGFGSLLLAERRPLVAGVLAGLTLAFRLDMGVAVVAGVVLAAPVGRLRVLGTALATGALALAPFVLVGGVGRFLDQTLGFALDEQELQRLPFPLSYDGGFDPNKLLELYFPAILLAGLAAWALVAVRRRPPLHALAPLPLALVGVAYLLARTDEFHLIPLAAVLPVLLGTALGSERSASTLPRAVLAIALALVILHGLDRQLGRVLHPPSRAEIPLAAADGVRTGPANAQALGQLGRAVRRRVPPGQPVFVANPRFDLVRVGDPLLYVLLERPNPTRYDVMQPGVVTTAPVQRELVRSLERARPRVVIRWLDPTAARREPNGAGRSSGVHVLDRWLAREYRPAERFGAYAVLVPRRP